MKKLCFPVAAVMGMMLLIIAGCGGGVSQQYVNSHIAAMDSQIGEIRGQTEANRTDISNLKKSASKQEYQMRQQASSVQAALSRAQGAGKLAAGRLIAQATISDESVRFAFNKNNLTDEAKASLDIFAGVSKEQDRNIYIEIQGHTDSIGSKKLNLSLGEGRAEAALRYLHIQHGIPLHRMNVFSYGESRPIGDNKTPSSRAKNRRVTLVVME